MNINILEGKILNSVSATNDEIYFRVCDTEKYKLYHLQDCCESVIVESIIGDLEDLVGTEIITAEEVSSDNAKNLDNDESFTWTFYKLRTIKGSVDIRFYGSSNGFYSESVDFERC